MPLKHYPAIIVRNKGAPANVAFGVVFPDLSGCTSMGDTVQDAVANAAEALALHIEGMIEDGEKVPEPSVPGVVPDWLAELEGNEVVARVPVPVEIPAPARPAGG
jgi:predicted RNase H-like HicB family nuclease